MSAPMSKFGSELYALGCAITRCRDLDRAMPSFVDAYLDSETEALGVVVIEPATSFEEVGE